MEIKRILWADDGSKESANALRVAEYFARLYSSDIIGLYVNYVFYPITPNYSYYAGYIEEAAEKNKKGFLKKFKTLKDRLSKKNINFTSRVIRGEVGKSIDKISTEKKAGIIAIGNTGKGLLTRILIGSNTLKVLRRSKVPVLSVPGFVEGNKYKINKILVPLDISENDISSLNFAIDVALKTNSSITVVYVLSVSSNVLEFPPQVIDQIFSDVNKSLYDIILDAKKNAGKLNPDRGKKTDKSEVAKLKIRKKLLVGLTPAIKIVDYAKKNKFDLIVMNSHSKGNVERFFLGSVTEEVIRNTRCPVISVKPSAK